MPVGFVRHDSWPLNQGGKGRALGSRCVVLGCEGSECMPFFNTDIPPWTIFSEEYVNEGAVFLYETNS